MSQVKKAKYFASLHKKGAPILPYNAWDSGSAVTIQGADSGPLRTAIPTHRGQRSGDCGQFLMSV
ncbi:hypothetical protein [Bradyrhizobium sp.]|uniref:hypothetical protein n=1 Tax=Bradyrhizobium sp. TaxID=376 RepID=UPI002C20E456|nr:hypothetical protein [Bradyrhizobium sp.]HWX61637.1 hypothetical protein [Bradyrhizobium sp.]